MSEPKVEVKSDNEIELPPVVEVVKVADIPVCTLEELLGIPEPTLEEIERDFALVTVREKIAKYSFTAEELGLTDGKGI